MHVSAGPGTRNAGQERRGGNDDIFCQAFRVRNKDHAPDKDDSPATRLVNMLKAWSVFHFSQLDGASVYKAPTVEEALWTRPDTIRTIMDSSGFVFRTGGDRAFYSPDPSPGFIKLPPDNAFTDMPAWCATEAHEMIHRPGARDLLNRDMSGHFGSAKYSEGNLWRRISTRCRRVISQSRTGAGICASPACTNSFIPLSLGKGRMGKQDAALRLWRH
jgi:antirestriction protein ArdC